MGWLKDARQTKLERDRARLKDLAEFERRRGLPAPQGA